MQDDHRSSMATDRPQRDRTRSAVATLTGCLAVASAFGWWQWGLSLSPTHAPLELHPLVVLAAFAIAELLLVHFEFRGNAQALTLGEVPLLIGLVFCPPGGLLLARLGGSVIALG